MMQFCLRFSIVLAWIITLAAGRIFCVLTMRDEVTQEQLKVAFVFILTGIVSACYIGGTWGMW